MKGLLTNIEINRLETEAERYENDLEDQMSEWVSEQLEKIRAEYDYLTAADVQGAKEELVLRAEKEKAALVEDFRQKMIREIYQGRKRGRIAV